MNARGLRTPRGKPLSAQTFCCMLRNPLYAGWLVARKWGDRYRGNHQPLVTLELFEHVQALLDGRRPSTSGYLRNNPKFPLRRLVRCARCQSRLTGSVSKGRNSRYAYYFCTTPACIGSVRTEKLEGQFQQLVEKLRPRPEYLSLIRAVIERGLGGTPKRLHSVGKAGRQGASASRTEQAGALQGVRL